MKNFKIAISLTIIILLFSLLCCTQAEVTELKFGHNMSEDSTMHTGALLFSKIVFERSNGLLKINIFPNQKLGNDHQMIEMAKRGEIDILLTPTAKLSATISSMQIPDLPFIFPNDEAAHRILDGKIGKALLKKLDKYGLMGISFWANGFKQFTANKIIKKPADFVGLRFRIMKSPMLAEQFRAFGAIPVPIDFNSTYKALKDKYVDGQENPLVAIYAKHFEDVQKYLIISI